MELALVFVPILLICKILINKQHKLIIIGTFAARLPVVCFTIGHYIYLRKSMQSLENRGIALVQPVVWLQVTLLWSMTTASLPSFRPLVSPFNTVMEESSNRGSSGFITTAPTMGSAGEKLNSAAALATFDTIAASSQTHLSQLETVATAESFRADFKGHSETIIQGPKRKFFRRSKKPEDIELGCIRHTQDFEVTYEQVSTPSRWSRAWQAVVEGEVSPTAGVEKTDAM
jgi:hypothetical protein